MPKTIIFLTLFVVCFFAAFSSPPPIAAVDSTKISENDLQSLEEVMDPAHFVAARFDGDIQHYLRSNIRYPKKARNARKEGRVLLQFVVSTEGEITNVEIVRRSAAPGFGFEEEAMRVIKSMPNFIPATYKGKPIATRYSVPIHFALQ